MSKEVKIIISDGAVQIVHKPKGIKVVIQNYDMDPVDAEDNPSCKQDKDGDWYQEMVWK